MSSSPESLLNISFSPLSEAARGQLRIDQRKAWADKSKRDNYKTPPCFNNGQKCQTQWIGLREPFYGYAPKSLLPASDLPYRHPAKVSSEVNAQQPKPDIMEIEEFKGLMERGTQSTNNSRAQSRGRGGLYIDSEDGELVAEQAAMLANSSVGS